MTRFALGFCLAGLLAAACGKGNDAADAALAPLDAAAPGLDAGEPAGSDAAEPGLDAAQAGPDASSRSPLYFVAAEYATGPSRVSSVLYGGAVAEPGERCYGRTIGNCYVGDCRLPWDGDAGVRGDGGTVVFAAAGDLSVAGANTVTLVADPSSGVYYPNGAGTTRHTAGETLTFEGTGGADLPSFSSQLTFTDGVEVLSPVAATPGAPVAIDRAVDFTATWTPTDESVWVNLLQGTGWTQDLQIICEFDGAAGTGTISAAVLANLARSADAPGMTGGLAVVHGAKADLSLGDYPLRLVVWSGTTFAIRVE